MVTQDIYFMEEETEKIHDSLALPPAGGWWSWILTQISLSPIPKSFLPESSASQYREMSTSASQLVPLGELDTRWSDLRLFETLLDLLFWNDLLEYLFSFQNIFDASNPWSFEGSVHLGNFPQHFHSRVSWIRWQVRLGNTMLESNPRLSLN